MKKEVLRVGAMSTSIETQCITRRHKKLCWKKLRVGKMKGALFFSANPCGPL